METTGTQSRLDGETYADYMSRLYRSNQYECRRRDEHGTFLPGKAEQVRPKWSFRPPLELAANGYAFMKEHGMSVTTYLTFALHKLHSESK